MPDNRGGHPMREEDDLRAALRTLERHAPDPDAMLAAVRASGDTAMPPPRPRGPWRRSTGAPGNWPGLIAPLAAAVAVVAVVAVSVLVAKVYAPGRAGGRANHVPTVAPPFPTWNGIPAYFLATAGMLNSDTPGTAQFNALIPPALHSHDTVGIIATATGKVVATVRLPGYVTATAASNGAFFAAVVRRHAATFYEIRLAAGGRATATLLPIPPVTAQIGSIAAAPDGSKLAISTAVPRGHSAVAYQKLIVAATGTGAERRWMTPAQDSNGDIGSMSWLVDGKVLAFNWYAGSDASPASALWLLNTTAASDNLLSGLAMRRMTSHGSFFNGYTSSPNGTAQVGIVLCLTGGCRPGSPGTIGGRRLTVGSVVQFATETGHASVRYVEPELPGLTGHLQNSGCRDPLWLSNSGSRMLLLCFRHRPATGTRKGVTEAHVLLLAGSRVTQLPWLTAVANEYVAFTGTTAMNAVPSFPLNP